MTFKTLKFALPIAVVALGAFWAFTMAHSTATTGYDTMKFECFSDGKFDRATFCTSTDDACFDGARTEPTPCTEQWRDALNAGFDLKFFEGLLAPGGENILTVYGLTMEANNSD